MNRRDLSPLSKASANRVEWVKAHHEVKINEAILAWQTAARTSKDGQAEITPQQRSDLQNLLIDMSVQFAEAEGRERLAITSSPRQFELDMRDLMDVIATEARERWDFLTAEFRMDLPVSDNGPPECDLQRRVRESLRPAARRLILDAWSAHEKRLGAECGILNLQNGETTIPASLAPTPSAKLVQQHRRDMIAQNVGQLRIDKGMSVEQLALDARLDKKTVVGVLHGRHSATPSTLKKLADVLGVAASKLTS